MSFHFFDMTRQRVLSSYHFHTQRILDRAYSIGATPDSNLLNFDTYIRNIYDILIVNADTLSRVRGTGDANFKRINLANPEWTLMDFYGGYTLDVSGFKGNGINAYVDTNFNPSLLVTLQKYQLNDASRGAVIVEEASSGTKPIDGISANSGNSMVSQNTSTHYLNSGVSAFASNWDNIGNGLHLMSRYSSNEVSLINKSIESVKTKASTAISNGSQLILRRNTLYSDGKMSSYFMGKSIPFTSSQLIRAAENADMANLGLQQIA